MDDICSVNLQKYENFYFCIFLILIKGNGINKVSGPPGDPEIRYVKTINRLIDFLNECLPC